MRKLFFSILLPFTATLATGQSQHIKDVNSYTDKTVTGNVSVESSSILNVKNVTVDSLANLRLYAAKFVCINGAFTVKVGSFLTIDKPIKRFHYEYDTNGNATKKSIHY